MKKILASLIFASAALSSSVAFAVEQTVTLSVPGMYCASCPYIVKGAISALKGIKSVDTKLADRTATVTFDDAVTSIGAITAATANVGYESSVIPAGPSS